MLTQARDVEGGQQRAMVVDSGITRPSVAGRPTGGAAHDDGRARAEGPCGSQHVTLKGPDPDWAESGAASVEEAPGRASIVGRWRLGPVIGPGAGVSVTGEVRARPCSPPDRSGRAPTVPASEARSSTIPCGALPGPR